MASRNDTNTGLTDRSKAQRAFVAGRFALELGGEKNMVMSIDGGHFKSETIGEKVGAEALETRYPGRQKFDDITVTVGTSMSAHFWEWIKKSVNNQPERRNGAIVSLDFDGRERDRREFSDALVAEVQFPTLDAKAKNPAFITVKISPEILQWKKGDGQRVPLGDPRKQKLWVPANFRFRMDGFSDSDLRWVQKVDQFSIKQNIILNPIGKELYVRKEVGRIEQPTLTFYVAETYARPWLDYWKNFVAEGEHVAKNEHTATIEYLSSDLQKVLMAIDFNGVGITAVSFDKHEAGTDQMRFVKVECYTESMDLKTSSDAGS